MSSPKIAEALHAIMAKASYVQKTGKNAFHGYRYAGEADLLAVLRPAMVEFGLMLIPSGQKAEAPDVHGNVMVEVAYTLMHSSGETWPEKIVAFGCGNDMSPKTGRIGDKGLYKALTGANKYLLFKLFQIETGDDPEEDSANETHHSNGHANGHSSGRQISDRPDDRQEESAAPSPAYIGMINAMAGCLDLADLADLKKTDGFKTAYAGLSQLEKRGIKDAGERFTRSLQAKEEDANMDEAPAPDLVDDGTNPFV